MGKKSDGKLVSALVSAESFGYGPASKLTCITKGMKDRFGMRVDFLGEGSALNFALQNSSLFDSVREYDGTYPDANKYDLVLSVMNPYTIIWGWFNRKKCIYVDSLYWFWKFEKKNFRKLEKTIEELRDAESIDAVWALIKDIPGHHLHYIAHKLSTISCIQYFNDKSYSEDIYRKNITNKIVVNPIIDTSYKKEVNRDTVLISLGGLLSPLNKKKEALAYVNLNLRLMEGLISEVSGKYKVILATNPEIVKLVKNVPSGVSVVSLSQEEMLKAVNKSVVVFTSAGITTMYECLMYNTPFFVLPELHDGHYPNYLRLAGSDKTKIEELPEVFPNALISPVIHNKPEPDPDSEIRKIQSIIKGLNATNDKTFQKLRRKINDFIPNILDITRMSDMALKQREFVLSDTVRGDDIFDVIERAIHGSDLPVVKRKYLFGIASSAVEIKNERWKHEFAELGKIFAKKEINIATGAAIGISHIIGVGAKRFGSRFIGFSPSSNVSIHQNQSDNALVDDFDHIHFNGYGFTARSLDFIHAIDALILISGRMGTLSEFTIAYEEGVPIFVLKGYGGISDKIEEIIKYANKPSVKGMFVANNISELVETLSEFLQSKYYR